MSNLQVRLHSRFLSGNASQPPQGPPHRRFLGSFRKEGIERKEGHPEPVEPGSKPFEPVGRGWRGRIPKARERRGGARMPSSCKTIAPRPPENRPHPLRGTSNECPIRTDLHTIRGMDRRWKKRKGHAHANATRRGCIHILLYALRYESSNFPERLGFPFGD